MTVPAGDLEGNDGSGRHLDRPDRFQALLEALATVDPIETGLDWGSRLDEYGMEAGEIGRRVESGEALADAAVAVFGDTCGFELEPADVARISDLYERSVADGP